MHYKYHAPMRNIKQVKCKNAILIICFKSNKIIQKKGENKEKKTSAFKSRRCTKKKQEFLERQRYAYYLWAGI